MQKNSNYYFPDTEKVGGIIFHYSKRLNGSFVNMAKKDLSLVIEKLKKYKNISLKSIMEVAPLHVYIYPDIKSFRNAMGYAISKVEMKQMHFMMPNSIEARYILKDEAGNIHMVLPTKRTSGTLNTFSSELVSMIVTEYIELNERQEYELKNTIKKYIKAERKKEEEEQEKEQEQEEQDKQEEELQEELEENDEEEYEAKLSELQEVEDDEMQEIIEAQEELEKDEKKIPGWLVYGWKAYICHRLDGKKNVEKFGKMLEKQKTPKATSLKAEKAANEFDLDVATASVEYIVTTYGYRSFTRLCENPEDIKGIFYPNYVITANQAKSKFNSEIKKYIESMYRVQKPVEIIEIDKDGNAKNLKIDYSKEKVIEN